MNIRKIAYATLLIASPIVAATSADAAITISNTGASPDTWTVSATGFASAAVTVAPTLPAGWTPDNSLSKWVSVNAQGTSTTSPATVNGNYTYATSFTGNVGDVLNFRYWADDQVTSFTLDGVATTLNNGTYGGTGTLGSFQVLAPALTHSLAFTVMNNGTPASGNPTGFRFEQVPGAVPEPAAWAMMIVGFGAVGFAMRSAKRSSDEKFETKIKRIAAGAAA